MKNIQEQLEIFRRNLRKTNSRFDSKCELTIKRKSYKANDPYLRHDSSSLGEHRVIL